MEGCMEVKAIYIHNPKTAGKTIYRSLYPELTRLYELNMEVPKHCTSDWVLDYFKGNKQIPFISSTRNPWARSVSLFKYLQTIGKIPSTTNFSDWLHHPIAPDHCLDPLERNPLQLQTYVTDKSGQVIVDHILRLEYLEEDFNRVARELGITKKLETFKSNYNGKGKSYKEYYSKEDEDFIRILCKWEIEKFNYTF